MARELRPTITASGLVAEIQRAIAEHGDLPIYAYDADTGWLMPFLWDPLIDRKENRGEPCLVLNSCGYGDM